MILILKNNNILFLQQMLKITDKIFFKWQTAINKKTDNIAKSRLCALIFFAKI